MFDEPDRPGVRQRQKASTHAALLEAARTEFERHGFDGTNVRAIAAQAGVSAATVIHHFGEKRELLYATLYEDLEATLDGALARLTPKTPLRRGASALGRDVFAMYRARPGLSRTLLKESLFAEGPWAQRFVAQTARVEAALSTLVSAALERGELTDAANPRLVSTAWLSFFYFALLGWAQGAVKAPEPLVDQLFEQHLAGLTRATRRTTR